MVERSPAAEWKELRNIAREGGLNFTDAPGVGPKTERRIFEDFGRRGIKSVQKMREHGLSDTFQPKDVSTPQLTAAQSHLTADQGRLAETQTEEAKAETAAAEAKQDAETAEEQAAETDQQEERKFWKGAGKGMGGLLKIAKKFVGERTTARGIARGDEEHIEEYNGKGFVWFLIALAMYAVDWLMKEKLLEDWLTVPWPIIGWTPLSLAASAFSSEFAFVGGSLLGFLKAFTLGNLEILVGLYLPVVGTFIIVYSLMRELYDLKDFVILVGGVLALFLITLMKYIKKNAAANTKCMISPVVSISSLYAK